MPGPPRVTRGTAEAVLQAFGGAGRIIRRNTNVQTGTPGDPDIKASIRPFSGTVFDGRHYCVEDWHVILISFVSVGDQSFTQQQAASELNPIVITFTLDGAELATTRTAIRRFLDTSIFEDELGVERAFFFSQGRVMSPADLSVGSHSLSFTAVDPVEGESGDQITFFIDAPGTGACA
jgi:hypothetical protein